MLRISSEETGQARFARVSIGGCRGWVASTVAGVGAAKPRLERGFIQR
jgi:hypothetical protein